MNQNALIRILIILISICICISIYYIHQKPKVKLILAPCGMITKNAIRNTAFKHKYDLEVYQAFESEFLKECRRMMDLRR